MVPLLLIRKEDVNKGCLWEEECSRPVKYRYASYAISHAYVTTSFEYSFGVLFPAALISLYLCYFFFLTIYLVYLYIKWKNNLGVLKVSSDHIHRIDADPLGMVFTRHLIHRQEQAGLKA